MFSSKNKKNKVYPCKPQFYYIKVGLWGSKLYRHVFVMSFTTDRLLLVFCVAFCLIAIVFCLIERDIIMFGGR